MSSPVTASSPGKRKKMTRSSKTQDTPVKLKSGGKPKVQLPAMPALSQQAKKNLKERHDQLCSMGRSEEEFAQWLLQLGKRADEVKKRTEKEAVGYGDLKRFDFNQYRKSLAIQQKTVEEQQNAEQANALCARLSCFSNVESFEATDALVKLVAKADAHDADELLENIGKLGQDKKMLAALMQARSDVKTDPQINDLLSVAINLQEEDVNLNLQSMILQDALTKLEKPVASVPRIRRASMLALGQSPASKLGMAGKSSRGDATTQATQTSSTATTPTSTTPRNPTPTGGSQNSTPRSGSGQTPGRTGTSTMQDEDQDGEKIGPTEEKRKLAVRTHTRTSSADTPTVDKLAAISQEFFRTGTSKQQ